LGETSRRDFLKAAAAAFAAAALNPISANEQEADKKGGFPDPSRHVFVVGDLHLTRKDPYAEMPILLGALESLSNGKKGFHIIFNGDLLEFPSMEEDCGNAKWQWEQFLILNSLLSNAGFITHILLGNHDGSEEFARQTTKDRIPAENFGTSAFSVENGARLILLSGMTPKLFDAAFLRNELSIGPAGHTFAFSHFPPDSMPSEIECLNKRPGYGIIAWNIAALRQISRYGATLISSHLHSPFIGSYHSHLLEKPVNVISTPSFSYNLPYFHPIIPGKRSFGITVLDTSVERGRAIFFDKDKHFHIPRREVDSYHGKYAPGDFSRRIIPGFPPNQFFFRLSRMGQ
jgi:hypothetical protein